MTITQCSILSHHAWRTQRRKLAIDRKQSYIEKLQDQLARARHELHAWEHWWYTGCASWHTAEPIDAVLAELAPAAESAGAAGEEPAPCGAPAGAAGAEPAPCWNAEQSEFFTKFTGELGKLVVSHSQKIDERVKKDSFRAR